MVTSFVNRDKLLVIIITQIILLVIIVFMMRVLVPRNVLARGFGIDSNNYIYIGVAGRIEVYHNNICIGTIAVTDRGYGFRVDDGHLLIYSDGSTVYYIELDGINYIDWKKSIIRTTLDKYSDEIRQMTNKKKFYDSEGNEYYAKNVERGYQIVMRTSTEEKVILTL